MNCLNASICIILTTMTTESTLGNISALPKQSFDMLLEGMLSKQPIDVGLLLDAVDIICSKDYSDCIPKIKDKYGSKYIELFATIDFDSGEMVYFELACKRGSFGVISSLIADCVNMNNDAMVKKIRCKLSDVMYDSILQGDLQTIKDLIERCGCDVNMTAGPNEIRILNIAVLENKCDIVNYLIEKRAIITTQPQVTPTNHCQRATIQYAAEKACDECIAALIYRYDCGAECITIPYSNQQLDILLKSMRLLSDEEYRLHVLNSEGLLLDILSNNMKNGEELLKYIFDKKSPIGIRINEYPYLKLAVDKKCNIKIIKLLLDNGVSYSRYLTDENDKGVDPITLLTIKNHIIKTEREKIATFKNAFNAL